VMQKIFTRILVFSSWLAAQSLERQVDPREARLRSALADVDNSPANGERIVAC